MWKIEARVHPNAIFRKGTKSGSIGSIAARTEGGQILRSGIVENLCGKANDRGLIVLGVLAEEELDLRAGARRPGKPNPLGMHMELHLLARSLNQLYHAHEMLASGHATEEWLYEVGGTKSVTSKNLELERDSVAAARRLPIDVGADGPFQAGHG